ncbi:hypothetical protein CHARACLAT_025338, partial [Characodon lateralis]|nr:hypothetical protein [Characodon lateralis]
ATVFGEDETEAVSLRIRPARLASSRLPGSLKLFDDRTGHITAGGGERGERVVAVLLLVGTGSQGQQTQQRHLQRVLGHPLGLLSMWRSSGSTPSPSRMAELLTLSLRE